MINFTKMHGTENDFILVDCTEQKIEYDYKILSEFLCNRNLSVGADGIIYILESKKADYKMRIFNKDGSEAEMCGNGIRCMAKYIYENKVKKEKIGIETKSGIKQIKINLENNKIKDVSVNMGEIILEPSKIPIFLPYQDDNKEINCIDIKIEDKKFEFYVVSIGNPHSVCFVPDIENIDFKKYASIIENYKYFPRKTNVEFVQIINENNIKVRVWERGVGETSSCGTGACCSAYVAMKKYNLKNKLEVNLKGGKLIVSVNDSNEIILTGPAEITFEGIIKSM